MECSAPTTSALLNICGKASRDETAFSAGVLGAVASQFGVVAVGPPVSALAASSGRARVVRSIRPGTSYGKALSLMVVVAIGSFLDRNAVSVCCASVAPICFVRYCRSLAFASSLPPPLPKMPPTRPAIAMMSFTVQGCGGLPTTA